MWWSQSIDFYCALLLFSFIATSTAATMHSCERGFITRQSVKDLGYALIFVSSRLSSNAVFSVVWVLICCCAVLLHLKWSIWVFLCVFFFFSFMVFKYKEKACKLVLLSEFYLYYKGFEQDAAGTNDIQPSGSIFDHFWIILLERYVSNSTSDIVIRIVDCLELT